MPMWRSLLIACALFFSLASFQLADRILQGKEGDYVVTEQDKNFCLLLFKEIRKDSLLFEEICIPMHLVKKSSTEWKKWLSDGAPGHTSWVQYEIDPHTLQLIEAYSFSQKGWLYLDESNHFLSQLLSLPLTQIPLEDRKKIGPSPRGDEQDRRKVWNPPMFHEGIKSTPFSEAWKTVWPQDSSLLSSCQITLYFPPISLSTFPSWIEASNGHFSYAIKIIDSGQNIVSPLKKRIPHRYPHLLKHVQKNADEVSIPIKAPSYYQSFSLFALDALHPGKQIGPIPFHVQKGTEKEEILLTVPLQTLSPLFQKNHHYKWIVVLESPEHFSMESEDFFRWAPLSSNP